VTHHDIDVSPNDCKDPTNCQPELKLSANWFHYNDTGFTTPLTEYKIGTFDVVLRLNVSNDHETAQKPQYGFNWNLIDVTLADDSINLQWRDKECKHFKNLGVITYNCNFSRNIVKSRPVS
jgi:hypothetical protein